MFDVHPKGVHQRSTLALLEDLAGREQLLDLPIRDVQLPAQVEGDLL